MDKFSEKSAASRNFLRLSTPFYGIFAFLRLLWRGGGQKRGWKMEGGGWRGADHPSAAAIHLWQGFGGQETTRADKTVEKSKRD
jgi:hypothetical protein